MENFADPFQQILILISQHILILISQDFKWNSPQENCEFAKKN